MFGSLVVVFPSAHEGGQLVLRHRDKEWTVDFTEKFMTQSEPSVCFIAFFGDIEHEVLPVTSGYRVTLTYNLYHNLSTLARCSSRLRPISTETSVGRSGERQVQTAEWRISRIRSCPRICPHKPQTARARRSETLKGSDRALADVCDALGLRFSLRLLYRGIVDQQLNLITTNELDVKHDPAVLVEDSTDKFHIMRALRGLGIEQVEGVDLIGSPWKFDPSLFEWDERVDNVGSPVFPDPESSKIREGCLDWVSTLRRIVREPVTQVLEVTPMASESVDINSPILRYGNQATLDFFYGTACMLIAVDPAKSRKPLVVQ
ncbi:hypothetical protein JVT61DRAFT_3526 [Boletus reticuloceps]|uniref:Fe2OG dioxygenase domain-containing protein n=1 Tax=Boletus reticuloceps TaxID=495285 RepID=A0A8I3A843_9AGAM|nr:hypothetical protein JVT61DRAFT_3526 [Boletus reticuloceps]